MPSEAFNRFVTCRLRAASTWPYASPAIFALTPVERPGCGGIVADKFWRIYFDPDVIKPWTNQAIAGKILFEVSHLVRGHAKRFSKQLGFNPAKTKPRPTSVENKRKYWAEAAKLEIIDDFDEERLTLPDGLLRAKDWNVPTKLLAENYYARLLQDDEQGGGGGGGGSKSSQQQGGGGQPNPQQAPPPPEGSAADGCPREWEEPHPDDDATPDDPNDSQSDIPGLSDAEAELIRREVARRVNEHSKKQGRCPAGLRRWAAEVEQPRIDYKRLVLQKVRNTVQTVRGNKDYSYRRPNRRTPTRDVIQPSLIDHMVNVALVVDTSGSMSERQLGEAIKIVGGVLKALPRRDAIRVMACDAAVYQVQKVFSESTIELHGGGGTDMSLAIVTASNQKPRPDVVLCLTDGYTDFPKEPTNGVPCVAIIVSNGTRQSVPKWIDYVCVPHVTDESDAAA